MKFICRPSRLCGRVAIPGSKSHTIRAVAIAALAEGESRIESPLVSADAESAARAAAALGADVVKEPGLWRVTGVGGRPRPRAATIDVGNSGTTLNVMLGIAALLPPGETVELTGDAQIRRRPSGPLAAALNELGASVTSLGGNGCPPFRAGGRLRGGYTRIACPSSQYLTSLLLACPLGDGETTIEVPLLHERPYVEMTLDWLARQGIRLEREGLEHFRIPGGQSYRAFRRAVPADFSSATFFFGAGALGGNDVTSLGLDMADSQGDRRVLEHLRAMGADVTLLADGGIRVRAARLHGAEIDLNETPDALPVMAVVACFARGTTVLGNVANARIKETDRIAVMACELRKMGAVIAEREDGLVIRESPLRGAAVEGHGDHRVVMALALAGLCADGETCVSTAEAAGVTFPEYADLMRRLGGEIAAE